MTTSTTREARAEVRGLEARRRRVAAWRAMCRAERFDTRYVMEASGLTASAARALLRRLAGRGLIERLDDAAPPGLPGDRRRTDGTFCGHVYRVTPEALGRVPRAVDAVHYWQAQAWQAMRIKRRFTASELARAMEPGLCSVIALRKWCKALAGAGYVRPVGAPTPGRERLYTIVRDAGPEPPFVRAGGKGDD